MAVAATSSREWGRQPTGGGPRRIPQLVPNYDVNGAPVGATLADGDYGDVVASGSGSVLAIDPVLLSAFMRTVLPAADAAAARATLAAQQANALLDALVALGAGVGLVEKSGAAAFALRAFDAAGGIPTLDGGGLLRASQLPALAITKPVVVASEAAQLALVAQEGDVAVRSDLKKSYIHNGGTAGTMADWTELQTPTDAVLSVNGETGAVTLDASEIPSTATGDVAATNVQAAIAELAGEKLAASVAATTYQPLDADLTALAGLASAADTLPYFTGAGAAALAALTAAGRALIAAADAPAQRVLLRNSSCMVKKAADQVAVDYTTATALTWDAEVLDDGGWHDTVTNNTRLTVPAGITRVRVGCSVSPSGVTASVGLLVDIRKSTGGGAVSVNYDGRVAFAGTISPNGAGRVSFASGWMPVVAGDYFECWLQVTTDTSINVLAAQSNFWIEGN